MITEIQLLKFINLHQPIKARELAKILSKEFDIHFDRSQINSKLYKLKSENKAKINDKYEWSVSNSVEIPTEAPTPTISFTEDQQGIIDLDPQGYLLISGQAGSGKTTVLAARASKIKSTYNKGSILFLTYNTALCSYVKKFFKSNKQTQDIEVRTFHDWAKHTTDQLGSSFKKWVTEKERKEQILRLIAESEEELDFHRLYNIESNSLLIDWWSEEIAWLFGQHIVRLDDYMTVPRTNRGVSIKVTNEDKIYIWNVYEGYLEWLEENEFEDYDNPAGIILRSLEQNNMTFPEELKYDHVMVDEVQDFDKSWLLAVVQVARVSLNLAGDLAQKIYKRNFTWKSVGIHVQGGRSRKLKSSHRTTVQIMNVAEYLIKNDQSLLDENATSALTKPNKNGELVNLLVANSPKDAYDKGYQWIANNFKRIKSTSVAVVVPFSRQIYPAQKTLEKLKTPAKAAKGASLGALSSGIVVTTYHQLKGLEFDHVVILGLHDEQYPSRFLNTLSDTEDIEHELTRLRRTLYMAMTRAKKTVTLVGSIPICRFLQDIPDELFNKI